MTDENPKASPAHSPISRRGRPKNPKSSASENGLKDLGDKKEAVAAIVDAAVGKALVETAPIYMDALENTLTDVENKAYKAGENGRPASLAGIKEYMKAYVAACIKEGNVHGLDPLNTHTTELNKAYGKIETYLGFDTLLANGKDLREDLQKRDDIGNYRDYLIDQLMHEMMVDICVGLLKVRKPDQRHRPNTESEIKSKIKFVEKWRPETYEEAMEFAHHFIKLPRAADKNTEATRDSQLHNAFAHMWEYKVKRAIVDELFFQYENNRIALCSQKWEGWVDNEFAKICDKEALKLDEAFAKWLKWVPKPSFTVDKSARGKLN